MSCQFKFTLTVRQSHVLKSSWAQCHDSVFLLYRIFFLLWLWLSLLPLRPTSLTPLANQGSGIGMEIISSSTQTLSYQCNQARSLCRVKNRLNVLADYNLIHPTAELFIFGVYRKRMKGKSTKKHFKNALILHHPDIKIIYDVIAWSTGYSRLQWIVMHACVYL